MSSNRLRIAMQKSGRLSQDSQDLLKSCGLKINKREDRLIAHVENMPIDILRVRDDDIPGLVMDGVVDLGIVGENVLEETRLEVTAVCHWQFRPKRFGTEKCLSTAARSQPPIRTCSSSI